MKTPLNRRYSLVKVI